ncbi:MAG: hypothetical protein QNJ55_34830 [Xenococcus sp. MO_188.B8]|nr:hypothetical protein [Xenococcus sp. MO_188.B8]
MPDEINIGILVVHGIGDQKQFDCLKGVAQSIVDSLQSEINKGYVEVSVDINRAETGTFQSLHPAWQEGEKAPINVRIKPSGYEKNYNLHLREVWWADLDRPQHLGKFIKFWFWGLSLWAIPPQENYPILNDPEQDLENLKWDTNKKSQQGSRLVARFEYFLIGLFLTICQPLLFILRTVLRFLDIDFPLTLIADYLGKLRLYQQPRNSGKDSIEDINFPPRFSIQRRMINALVRMAISDYDRWYVWSHSLGSIVAYNAFSMPEATLSHYVSHSIWEEIETWDTDHSDKQLLFEILNTNTLRPKPYRPVWQRKRISRKSLFDKCEGLLTYGSPFWRIADLWPDLVKRNTQADFKSEFNWYNVLDPSDPVATRTAELFRDGSGNSQQGKDKRLYPKDVFYRTPRPFLLAHTSYLSISTNTSLISQLWLWVCYKKEIIENPNNLYGSLKHFWQEELIDNRKENSTDNSDNIKKIYYLRYHQLWRFIWWLILILVSLFILDKIWVVLTCIFQNLSTFFIPSLQKLSTHFYDDSSLTSLAHFLQTFTAVLVCFTPIIGIGLLIWLLFRCVKSNLFPVIAVCFTPFIIFLTGYCVIYLADNYFSTLAQISDLAIKLIGNLTFSKLFLGFIVFLIVLGFISQFLKKPIKSYILEYLQDRPNQPINEKKLQKEFKISQHPISRLMRILVIKLMRILGFQRRKLVKKLMVIIWGQDVIPKIFNTTTDVIENVLIQLDNEKKIKKIPEDNQYYFPYYTFSFNDQYDKLKVTNFLFDCLKTTNNTSSIRGLRDLERYTIKELRFNPKENLKNNGNEYFLPAPSEFQELTNQDSYPVHLLRYKINQGKITVDFNTVDLSCYNFTFVNYKRADVVLKIVNLLCALRQNNNDAGGIRSFPDLEHYIIEQLRFKPKENRRNNDVNNGYFLPAPPELEERNLLTYTINENNIQVDFSTLVDLS